MQQKIILHGNFLTVTKTTDQTAPSDRMMTVEVEGILRSPSDGYHTFEELYDHRITLFLALCKQIAEVEKYQSHVSGITGVYSSSIWRSKKHSDGELCFGTGTQFVMGIGASKGKQISYHLPIERWDEAYFAETRETAPEWDGHSSEDVLARLKNL